MFSKSFEEKLFNTFYCLAASDWWNRFWFLTILVCFSDPAFDKITFDIFMNIFDGVSLQIKLKQINNTIFQTYFIGISGCIQGGSKFR